MHVVTKILVVFCAILSLLLSALTMALAANADRYRSALASERAEKIAAKTGAENEIAQFAQERLTMATRIQSLEQDLATRTAEVSTLQAERTGLRADLERANADTASIKNQISQIAATAEIQAALIKNYSGEVTHLRDELLAASKKEIDLVDRINDLESAREVLEQNARALKEQLQEAKEQVQLAQQGTTAAAAASEPRELPGPLIRARVTEVFKSPGGQDMVVISEGANRGIKENALMNITRGPNFVARLIITTVEPSRAIGRIDTYGRKDVQPMKDDVVLSRLE